LGGVAQHTQDVVLLMESAGFDTVLVETVGLGQSEIEVDQVVDMLLLVVPPAMGDELQGVKKGIMEVVDLVVVNKADGNLADLARHAAVDYTHALQLARRKRPDWKPRVRRCSALTGEDLTKVYEVIQKFHVEMTAVGELTRKRLDQAKNWMWSEFAEQLILQAKQEERIVRQGEVLTRDLADGYVTPRHAARRLVEALFLTLPTKARS
jgi:LAO/AO transport system kinase